MAKRGPSKLNLLLAVDKPVGITSHDVVARVRRALDERRVGHAGTLDPLASGVMIVGVGQATRLLGMLTLDTKSYIAAIRFGSETNTDDAEGEVIRTAPIASELFDEGYAARVVAATVGAQEQVPPQFSAISVNGVRSYKRAREGDSFELPPRPVEVVSAQLISVVPDGDSPVWNVAYTVSKGTYIRALARDLGRSLRSAAHIQDLRRTASGSISLADCTSLDDLDVESASAHALDPVAALGLHSVEVSERIVPDIRLGRDVHIPEVSSFEMGESLCLVRDGKLLALAHREKGVFSLDRVFPEPIAGVDA